MASRRYQWRPEWRLAEGQILTNAEALARLDYALEWRAWLWRRPARDLLAPFEKFRDKRILEIGSRYGKLSCLMAAAGGRVTGADVSEQAVTRAREEARRWGLEERVNFEVYNGDSHALPRAAFDYIVSKSVLVIIARSELDRFLEGLAGCLAPGGQGLFMENANNRLNDLIRRRVVYRGNPGLDRAHWAFFPQHLETVSRHFGRLEARRYLGLVWALHAESAKVPAHQA